MKNRILCRLMSLGMTVLIIAGAAAGCSFDTVYGAAVQQENTGIAIKQSAVWTKAESFQGELTMEISGLKAWVESQKDGKPEDKEEASGAVTVTPLPSPTGEADTDKENTDKESTDKESTDKENTDDENSIKSNGTENQKNTSEEENISKNQTESENVSETENRSGSEGTPETESRPGSENMPETESRPGTGHMPETESTSGSERTPETESAPEAEYTAEEAEYMSEAGIMLNLEDLPASKNMSAADTRAGNSGTNRIVYCAEENSGNSSTSETDEPGYFLLKTRISQYFQVPEESLPEGCTAQELMIPGEDGALIAITQLTCPISGDDLAEEPIIFRIPLLLREEYRYSESVRTLPVHPEESVTQKETEIQSQTEIQSEIEGHTEGQEKENTAGQGSEADASAGGTTFLAYFKSSGTQLLAQAGPDEEKGIVLETAATPADLKISVKADTESPKAGQTLTYYVTVVNTGRQPLPLVSMESSITPSGLSGTWIAPKAQETDISGQKAILTNLKEGEMRELTCQVKLPESLTEPVIGTITASAQKITEAQNLVVRGTSLKTPVTPLKVDFTVSKSADRTTAAPGDTITYQICIRNTGERTLHSVLSTERFQTENISAQFVEKEGVLLSGDKTQALISQIPPGEVFSLEAVVTLPEKLKSKELINQVLVRTKETGDQILQSSAGVKILEISPTPGPSGEYGIQNGGGTTSGESNAGIASDSPKTSDDSHPLFWAVLLGAALIAAVSAFKRKSKH